MCSVGIPCLGWVPNIGRTKGVVPGQGTPPLALVGLWGQCGGRVHTQTPSGYGKNTKMVPASTLVPRESSNRLLPFWQMLLRLANKPPHMV